MPSELKQFFKYIFKSKLIILGLIVYFLFNISALSTHFMDFFFFGSSIHHCCQGLDFYQIPNAAHSFINGGGLDGKLPPGVEQYSKNYVSNFNVYHPLLTIVLGGLLILTNPEISIRAWIVVKIFITLFTVFYIYKNFKDNKYLSYSLFIFLIFFSQYNDIKISQFQFLLNISVLYLLINLVKNKNKTEGGIFYFFSLIVKPISLLFLPVLLIKKEKKIAFFGLSIFIISTFSFNIIGVGDYFTNNIWYHLTSPMLTKGIDFMSLDALIRSIFSVSPNIIKLVKYSLLILIYLFAFKKNVHIVTVFYLLIVFFLFFYDILFQYHYSVLGPIFAICILSVSVFQNKISRLLILLISLPNIFFILRIFNFEVYQDPSYGWNPTVLGWQIVSSYQLLLISILSIIILLKHIKIKEYKHEEN